jgi:HAD superfamily hydrolase (TIGR01549 family)
MSPIKGVIFDLGNTLMYLDHQWKEVIEQGGKELAEFLVGQGFDVNPGQFADDFISLCESLWLRARERQVEYTADYTLITLLAKLGYQDVSQELIDGAVNAFFAFEESYWRPYPEAQATLHQLSERGYRLALISNATYDPLIQRLVDKGDLRKWLDISLSSAGVGFRKPNPQIFQKVLDHWGFTPPHVAMVGDTLQFDVLGAQNAGMKGILATWDLYPNYNLGNEDIIPDAKADSLSHLIEVITSLDENTKEGE